MSEVVTLGECLASFLATTPGPLAEAVDFERHVAGAEANVAVGLARLGHTVSYIGRVGSDGFGTAIVRKLRGEGVDVGRLPIDPDAITADFTEDLGLFSADEVTKFVANVYAAPAMENDAGSDNFSFRGLSQRFNVSRNYFRWYVPSDTYNVERIDFGKGSNSLIFGDVEPGGQGSVFTKRAQFRNHGNLLAQYGSENAYRVQFDVNRKLTKNLAVRLNVVRREEKTFQDFSTYKFEAYHAALTWRPFKNTEVRIEAEKGEIHNQRG